MTNSSHHRPTPRRPFEDLLAESRWETLDAEALRTAAEADPLGFIADNLPGADRRVGSLAVLLDGGPAGHRSVHVVHDAVLAPGPEECRALLDRFAEIALAAGPQGRVSLGLIHHRRGDPRPDELDLRWANALADVAAEAGLGVLGVVARTECGALVRVSPPRAA